MKQVGLLACALLAGCGAPTQEQTQAAETETVLGLLRTGSGAACTNDAVVQTVRDIVYRPSRGYMFNNWSADHKTAFDAQVVSGVEMVTLEGADAVTSTVSCAGTFFATWNGDGGEAPISYEIKPALDTNNFIVEVFALNGPTGAYNRAIGVYYGANILPGQQAEAAAREYESFYTRGSELCQSRGQYDYLERASWLRQIETAGGRLDAQSTRDQQIVVCVTDRLRADETPQPSAPAAPTTTVAPAPTRPQVKEDRIEFTGPPPAGTDAPPRPKPTQGDPNRMEGLY